MLDLIHFFPGLCLLAVGLALEIHIVRQLLRRSARSAWIWTGAVLALGLLFAGYLLEFDRIARYFPVAWATWLDCAAIVELIALMVAALRLAMPGDRPEFEARLARVF